MEVLDRGRIFWHRIITQWTVKKSLFYSSSSLKLSSDLWAGVSVSYTSGLVAPAGGALASSACWRLCCLIWLRDGRGWLAAATVSLAQSSTSLCRSSVKVPRLLLLLLVWTWASRVIGWGEGEGVAAVSGGGGCVWPGALWAAALVLRDDPEKRHRRCWGTWWGEEKRGVKSLGCCMAGLWHQ